MVLGLAQASLPASSYPLHLHLCHVILEWCNATAGADAPPAPAPPSSPPGGEHWVAGWGWPVWQDDFEGEGLNSR